MLMRLLVIKVEDTKLPGFLSSFNGNVVSTAILMKVFLGIIMDYKI